MPGSGDVRIGISGWRYKPWRGVFYPKKLPQKKELEYAASVFRSVEINGTFYSLQRPKSFEKWAAETPDDFVFAVKGSRFITHMKRLKEVETPLANFLASGIFRLGRKLGPILWQFPANFSFEPERMAAFLKLLPRDSERAEAIASCHDRRVEGRGETRFDVSLRLRHAIEIRHESFVTKEFIDMLRAYDVALVCADTVKWPLLMDVTADFVYCRLHGSKVLYTSGSGKKDLDRWAMRVAAWAKGGEPEDGRRVLSQPAPRRPCRDVFVYFDNDAKVRAPVDAKGLISRVSKLL